MKHSDLNTLFTGRKVTFLETVDSTNTFMNNLLSKEDLPEGAVVVARKQTAGRGHESNSWSSQRGKNLLVSFAFYPIALNTQNLFMLSKVFSLGVYDCVKEITTNLSYNGSENAVKIKWPNDIYVGDKKLCGMLIENSIRNPQINHTIVGVGLNVNQNTFPAELPNPVSLRMILGKEIDLNDCFALLCNALEKRYLQMNAKHFDQINDDYLNALYRYHEFHWYENTQERFRAKITAVADDGNIFLKRENGLIEKYDFKEVRFIV